MQKEERPAYRGGRTAICDRFYRRSKEKKNPGGRAVTGGEGVNLGGEKCRPSESQKKLRSEIYQNKNEGGRGGVGKAGEKRI